MSPDQNRLHAEIFEVIAPEVKEIALGDVIQLTAEDLGRIYNRVRYLTKTRIGGLPPPAARCHSKVIYDQAGANIAVKRIWNFGRGEMRVYACPLCNGYHLTHKPCIEGLNE